MIAWVEGTLRDKTPVRVVVDVGGVGYELHISLSTFAELPEAGKTVALFAYTVAREDALLLYGFATAYEKGVFEMLIRANRVGPKLAQTMLSGMAPERLVAALRDGEVAALKGIPGVGGKTAARMIVELRERANELGAPDGGAVPSDAPHDPGEDELRDQLLSALVNLGYPKPHAARVVEAAVAEAGEGAGIESLIRVALRRLAR
jgi:Holliday junction DNA helicase RuvA